MLIFSNLRQNNFYTSTMKTFTDALLIYGNLKNEMKNK